MKGEQFMRLRLRPHIAIDSLTAIGLAGIVIVQVVAHHVTGAPLAGIFLAGIVTWLAILSARDWWAYKHETRTERWDRRTDSLRRCAAIAGWTATVWGLFRRYERAASAIERSDSFTAEATHRDGSAHNPRHGGDGVDRTEES